MSISLRRAALLVSVMSVTALAAPAMAEPGGCLNMVRRARSVVIWFITA